MLGDKSLEPGPPGVLALPSRQRLCFIPLSGYSVLTHQNWIIVAWTGQRSSGLSGRYLTLFACLSTVFRRHLGRPSGRDSFSIVLPPVVTSQTIGTIVLHKFFATHRSCYLFCNSRAFLKSAESARHQLRSLSAPGYEDVGVFRQLDLYKEVLFHLEPSISCRLRLRRHY